MRQRWYTRTRNVFAGRTQYPTDGVWTRRFKKRSVGVFQSIYFDNAQVYVDIQVTSADVADRVDSATVYVDLQSSGVDVKEVLDSAMIYVNIQNMGGECYSTFSGQMLGEGEANSRWRAGAYQARWSGEAQERWVLSELSTESGC